MEHGARLSTSRVMAIAFIFMSGNGANLLI